MGRAIKMGRWSEGKNGGEHQWVTLELTSLVIICKMKSRIIGRK